MDAEVHVQVGQVARGRGDGFGQAPAILRQHHLLARGGIAQHRLAVDAADRGGVAAQEFVAAGAVRIEPVGVAGDVPTVDHVVCLARIGEIAAAGRPLDREPPRPLRHRRAGVVEHGRGIAGHGPAGRARTDILAARGNDSRGHWAFYGGGVCRPVPI